jgi:peptide/nickel transport system substrate-binding protein
MARTAGEGVGLPSRNIYAPTSRFYADIDTAGYDPELAKKLLDEAKADGYDGTLTYIGQSDPASQAGAVAVKAMLEKVGFEVKTEGLTNVADQIQRIYVTHDYDLVVAAQSLSDELLYSRLSTGEYSTSPQNPSGYANPEMDKLIDELRGADEERTKEIAHEVDKLWQETIPGVAMAAGAFFYPWTDQVHGVVPSTEQLLLFGEAWKG